ncbi:cyclase family protein [Actinoplanes awajinensis]|uniref:Cyclase n=1 Tax=Actinoplanes awajinensis subsp. mycoplanecinus TaxID=135947 RepID=A0A0X3V444_9ACTN|nr:cyclase family protein [Actinoplanes awajinensis]KUL39448.1 cyclase [Actinoplanes awajinensis subsp. mycoplanecinus]
MRIIDLSTPIDATVWEPNPTEHTVLSPAEGAVHMAESMRENHGLDFDPAVLPDGELLSLDTLRLTTHTGTHVDAPSHYGSITEYGPPRHIDQMPLNWFFRPGLVLDVSDAPVGTVGADRLRQAFDHAGRAPEPMDVVLLHTGANTLAGTPKYFTDFVGLDGPATDLLLDRGVRVIGTDAFSLDAPFGHMIVEYQKNADPSVLWPAHFAGRRREYCQIERLNNLEALLDTPRFTVCCFPVKIANAGAGWARAVALVPEE